MLVVWWPSFCFPPSQLGVIFYDGRYVSSGYLPSMFCALEVWPETRFSPSRRFLNVDCRCNSGFLKRIAYTPMPYKTGLGLLGVARNPANGFPARLLGCTNMPTRLVVPDWFTISQGRWLETALFPAMAVNPSLPVAEGAAGNPSCKTSGRILYFRYSSQG